MRRSESAGVKPELTPPPGRFHAGAIIAWAGETAPAAAMGETHPTGEGCPELFPLTLRPSAHLITGTNRGTLGTEAGPAPPAVTAPTDRPDR